MNSTDKLILSAYIVKQAFGVDRQADPATIARSVPLANSLIDTANAPSIPTQKVKTYGSAEPKVQYQKTNYTPETKRAPAAAPALPAVKPRINLNPNDISNLQSSFKKDLANHFGTAANVSDGYVQIIAINAGNIMKQTPLVSSPKADASTFFKQYMGSDFDASSRVDRNKLKFLQSLQDSGMNLDPVNKANAAAVYSKMRGMKF